MRDSGYDPSEAEDDPDFRPPAEVLEKAMTEAIGELRELSGHSCTFSEDESTGHVSCSVCGSSGLIRAPRDRAGGERERKEDGVNARDAGEAQRPLFGPEDLIHAYTRADAIEDGTLVDVSETASEAGIRYPLALTRALWADVEDIPPSKKGVQDASGRLWDLLWMARHAAANVAHPEEKDRIFFNLVMPVGRKKNYRAKMVLAPGDDGAPVLTVLREDED